MFNNSYLPMVLMINCTLAFKGREVEVNKFFGL